MSKLEQIPNKIESIEKPKKRKLTKQELIALEEKFDLKPEKENPEMVLERNRKIESLRKKAGLYTSVTDFVPVVGSAKMVMEGFKGKQYGTEKEIKGMQRLVHGVSGAGFLALDLTGVGAIGSTIGKGVVKLGSREMFRSAEEKLAREVIEKEATKLVVRGEKRIEKKEKIANSPEIIGKKNSLNIEHIQLAKKVLSGKEYNNFQKVINSSEEERARIFIANKLKDNKLTKKEVVYTTTLGTLLYMGIPAAIALGKTSALAFMAPSVASGITALQGSSLATMVLPSSLLSTIGSLSSVTIGSLAMSLPLLAQMALIAPPLIAAGYVGSKLYRGIRNFINESKFKKEFGVSVKDVTK